MSGFWDDFLRLVYRDKLRIGDLIIDKCKSIASTNPVKNQIDAQEFVDVESPHDHSFVNRRRILRIGTGTLAVFALDKAFDMSVTSLFNFASGAVGRISSVERVEISDRNVRSIESMRRSGLFDTKGLLDFSADSERLLKIVKQFSSGSSLLPSDINFLHSASLVSDSSNVRSFSLNLLSSEMNRCGLLGEACRFNELEISYLSRDGDEFARSMMSRVHIYYNSLAYIDYSNLGNTSFILEFDLFVNSIGARFGFYPNRVGVVIDDSDLVDVLIRIGVPFLHMVLFKFISDQHRYPHLCEDLCFQLILFYQRILRISSVHGLDMSRGIWNHFLPISMYFHANEKFELRNKFIDIALRGGDIFSGDTLKSQILQKKNRFDHVYVLLCILVYRAGLSSLYQESFFDLIFFVKNADFIKNGAIRIALCGLASRDGRLKGAPQIDPVMHYVVRAEGFDAVIAP